MIFTTIVAAMKQINGKEVNADDRGRAPTPRLAFGHLAVICASNLNFQTMR